MHRSIILTTLLSLVLINLTACSPKSDNQNKTTLIKKSPESESVQASKQEAEQVIQKLQTEVVKLYQHPTLTVIMVPKSNVTASIQELLANGGKLIYDPNMGLSGDIPFYIAELTPDQINDSSFLRKLNLKAASVDRPDSIKILNPKTSRTENLRPETFIPVNSVKLNELLTNGQSQESLGKGVTVAVIDTGIDASHPAFNGRVAYWYDGTQETRTKLQKSELNAQGELEIDIDGTVHTVEIPSNLPAGDLYFGILDESKLQAQLSQDSKIKKGYKDINSNQIKDKFLILAVENEEGLHLLFDDNANLKFDAASEKEIKVDYNQTTQESRKLGMVHFPTRNNILSYPLLAEKDEDCLYVGLGIPSGSHGTHVAGIIAANDSQNNLIGAAPAATLMSLRVCSEISCTDSAIIKGLYKAFYNGKYIPDVVNISLGSHEGYSAGVYYHLLNDLSAKFGTIFFISASNSGPGFRSLNHFGNSGAVVMVGANVSKQTLRDQYNLPEDVETQMENLLYFSSLGPSYTGEMKPNIVAPGGAIAPVIASEDYMAQMNGTSMSSPLAAGTFAAILSKVKEQDANLLATIKKLREVHRQGSTQAQGSLLPYVFAMRDSLQRGATDLPDLSRAQQGYGLIHAGKTVELLKENLEKLNEEKISFFQVVINNNQKSYDRSGEITKFQKYSLSLAFDGERTKEQKANIMARGIDVTLDRVEILDNDGTVRKISNNTEYFYIGDHANASKFLTSYHVALNNRRNDNFLSYRKISNMEVGKTYIAHYKLSSAGAHISDILDVVHVPFELTKKEIQVNAIDPARNQTLAGFAAANSIQANSFHRYPILVSKEHTNLNITVAIDPNSQGTVYAQLYNPDGKEVILKAATNNPINGYGQAKISIPTIKNGKIFTGTWELTLSTASSVWNSSANYELLVEADRFGSMQSEVSITAGESINIPVYLNNDALKQSMMIDFKQVHRQSVDVKSHHMSFHPLIMAKNNTSFSMTVMDSQATYWGNIDPKLYTKVNDKFISYKDVKSFEQGGRRYFQLTKETDEQLYYALDTISNFDIGESTTNSSKVIVDIEYNKSITGITPQVKITNYSEFNMANIMISTPDSLSPLTALENETIFLRGTLVLMTEKAQVVMDSEGNRLFIPGSGKIDTIKVLIQSK